MTLRIPAVTPETDMIRAALMYAEAGWYVLPVDPDTKRPASFLRERWQHKSSRDSSEIVDWFAGTRYLLGLHVGRSGGVVMDVDHLDKFPERVRHLLAEAPYQSTRIDQPGRGHYVFEVPEGRLLGNSRGTLGKEWGEVRGLNGIIVVAPSTHVESTGRYEWLRLGQVPVLPQAISEELPEGQAADDAVTDSQVKAFLEQHTAALKPHLLTVVTGSFAKEARVGSRHEALVTHLVWAMREARAGMYGAKPAMDALWSDWNALMANESKRWPRSEFRGAMAWAVAQALGVDPEERREEIQKRLDERDARQAASLGATAPSSLTDDWTPPRSVGAYFTSDGLNLDLLVSDILDMGPIAQGRDGFFWEYRAGVWRRTGSPPNPDVVEGRIVKLMRGRFRGSHVTNATAYARHKVGHIDCEPVEGFMNYSNGMLDWRTGELLPHAAHYGSTVQFPVAWEPDATCPIFEEFLTQILEPDYIPLVWEMLGYLMYSGNPLQKAFLFHGAGANGKGTLMRVITALLGLENISAVDLDDLNDSRFASSELFGMIANLAGDIDSTFQERTARFKKLTGGDVISAEKKHRDHFRFTCWAVPIFSANRIPGSADTSHGYLRRWVIMHFHRQFSETEADRNLDTKLAAELPGIAAKAVQSLRVLMARGNFQVTGKAAQAAEEFAETIDQVRQWIKECTLPTPGHSANAGQCYAAYKAWADRNGNGRLKAQEFYARLEAAGYRRRKSGTHLIDGLTVMDSTTVVDAGSHAPDPD